MNNFKQLGLSEDLLKVLDKMGFEQATPIQSESIPALLENPTTDFIGLAQTGTGKTAAFGLPLVDLVDADNKATQALIMAPTRELGQQTAKQLVTFSEPIKSLNVEVVYGGAAITNQIRALKKPTQIVVATPGRLLDLIRRKAISLANVRYVVLDEADEMLNMGFKEDIDDILSNIKEDHATWLFSATMPNDIRRIVKKYMSDPIEVAINTEQKSNADITHQYIVTKTADKLPALRRFLDMQPDLRGIMFCRTKRETQGITDELSQMGYGVEALHGDLSQAQRDAAMRRFKSSAMQLLIATDVAARGIDVNDLSYVIHHTLPDQLESYTHRSGRTGRAGKKGISLAFINPRESRRLKELENKLQIKFETAEVPSVEELKTVRLKKWANQLLEAEVHDLAAEHLEPLLEDLKDLSKEDLLNKLISKELEALLKQNNKGGNLNQQTESSRQSDRDRGGRDRDRRSSDNKRYFINIGEEDGMSKFDLIDFVHEITSVNKKDINNISIQRRHAYFDVKSGSAKNFESKFQGLEMEDREIRVNEETNRDPSSNRRSGAGGGGGRRRDNRGRPQDRGGRSGGGGHRKGSGGRHRR